MIRRVVSAPPQSISGVDGRFCLSLATLTIIELGICTDFSPAGLGSSATLGPFTLSGLGGIGNLYARRSAPSMPSPARSA